MILYHGSSNLFKALEKKQAEKRDDIEVPADELLDGIYLTPDFGFALAVAAMPDGLTEIDDETKTIKFENSEHFDPNKHVYIYQIDTDKIPTENLKQIDERQYVVTDISKIFPENVQEFKAGEVEKYYRIIIGESEPINEMRIKSK